VTVSVPSASILAVPIDLRLGFVEGAAAAEALGATDALDPVVFALVADGSDAGLLGLSLHPRSPSSAASGAP
jgi:hypothetical protein